ncbi:TetR/AcrR family transcriptional regulator [Nocardia sp. NPDC059240]|uniref:TetR/AcrR family transcriptional regulator n=1 Tax=Nocardia sp. NPDC059240 TaxID=3346786 RepID=UPI00369B33B6
MTESSVSTRKYSGRPVEDRRAERRTEFLAAGLEVFGGGGYRESSITSLCRAAGLARGQFYEHFGNREDLLLAVYDLIQDDARHAVTAAVEVAGTADVRVHMAAAVTAYAESVGRDPRRAAVSFVEIVGVSPRVEQHRLTQRETWVQFFIERMRQSVGPDYVPPGGFRAAATGFIGALMALVQQWSTAEPRPDLADVTAVLTAFLTGLVVPAAG